MTAASHPAHAALRRLALPAVVGVVGCVVAWWLSPEPFLKSWLAAAMLPWSLSIGSLIFLLILCLTGGRWGQGAWPWLAMNTRLMPLVALLFVPWICGIGTIYPWANSRHSAAI